MIRVLELLVTTAPGGGPKQVYDLVRHLPKAEFEVVVAGPRDGAFFERFRELGLRVVDIATNRVGPWPLLKILHEIRHSRIDVVHSHGKGAGLYSRFAGWLTGAAVVHTFHGIHYERYSRPWRRGYLTGERWLGRGTDRFINVSSTQADEGVKQRLFEPSDAVTILNGIDLAELDADLADPGLDRARLGLTEGAAVIGSVARFDPVKRVEVLIQALALLAPRIPGLTLVLVGGGEDERRLRRLATDVGLGERVIFTGPLDNPAGAYRLFDLYVATSRKEGLPLALLEAMGARLAIVATDVPGHQDLVVHGETGLLVPVDDPAALADAIATLLADPERRRRMGEAGRRRVAETFTIDSMVDKTAEVYREVSRRAAASRR